MGNACSDDTTQNRGLTPQDPKAAVQASTPKIARTNSPGVNTSLRGSYPSNAQHIYLPPLGATNYSRKKHQNQYGKPQNHFPTESNYHDPSGYFHSGDGSPGGNTSPKRARPAIFGHNPATFEQQLEKTENSKNSPGLKPDAGNGKSNPFESPNPTATNAFGAAAKTSTIKFGNDPNNPRVPIVHDYPNGNHYEGEWKSNQPDGKGKLTYPNGDVYEGGFLRGLYNGKGRFSRKNGDYVQGSWLIGVKDGEFEELWSDGQENFKGTYENGKREGYGVLQLKGDKVYQGYFSNDKFHGQGKILFHHEKLKYQGEFRQGEMSGKGIIIWLNEGGATYDGEVINGLRNGFGVYTDNKRNKYCGYWKNDKKDGQGMLVTEQGAKYKMVYNMDNEVLKELDFNM